VLCFGAIGTFKLVHQGVRTMSQAGGDAGTSSTAAQAEGDSVPPQKNVRVKAERPGMKGKKHVKWTRPEGKPFVLAMVKAGSS
jgi:hypothetical protein